MMAHHMIQGGVSLPSQLPGPVEVTPMLPTAPVSDPVDVPAPRPQGPGSFFDIDVNEQRVVSAAEGAMLLMSRQLNTLTAVQKARIVSAKQKMGGLAQVVHDTTYDLVIEGTDNYQYRIIVVDNLFEHDPSTKYSLVSYEATSAIGEAPITPIPVEPVRSEDSGKPLVPIMGGETECTSSPPVLAAAAAGMDVINSKLMASGVTQQFYVTEVTSARKQVVAGLNYRITYNAGPLNCPNGHTVTDRINEWLSTHSATLNGFGDPLDTGYTGGSPLFDEITGTSLDRDEYILKQNPHQPWNLVCVNKADIASYSMTVWDQPWRTPRYMMTETTHTISVSITDEAGSEIEEEEEDEDEEDENDALTQFAAFFAGAALVAMLAVSYRHLLVYRHVLAVYEASQVAPVFTEVEPHVAQRDYAPVLNGDASKQI